MGNVCYNTPMFRFPLLELTVFITGASVMVTELVGSRLLAPYVGTTIFVWTSLIGVILASLSVGYWWGGELADKRPRTSVLSYLLLAGAVLLIVTTVMASPFLDWLTRLDLDIRVGATIAGMVLFAPASVLLGAVSPYAVRLRLTTVTHSGATIGRMYALSTIGSIVGTFLTGFVLLAYTSSHMILLSVGMTLVVLALVIHRSKQIAVGIGMGIVIAALTSTVPMGSTGDIHIDTAYNHVRISTLYDGQKKETMRLMQVGIEHSSAVYLENTDLVFPYMNYYDLAFHFNPAAARLLMIGGAGFAYPRYALSVRDNLQMDVVEIDPQMHVIAKKYFGLGDEPGLRVHNMDGRIFISGTDVSYDALLIDAFSSNIVPFHLTTQEFMRHAYDRLTDGGVLIMNTISAISGDDGRYLRAQYHTIESVFDHVYLFPVSAPFDASEVQNIMLVGVKSVTEPNLVSIDIRMADLLARRWKGTIPADVPLLTDGYAPVEWLTPIL